MTSIFKSVDDRYWLYDDEHARYIGRIFSDMEIVKYGKDISINKKCTYEVDDEDRYGPPGVTDFKLDISFTFFSEKDISTIVWPGDMNIKIKQSKKAYRWSCSISLDRYDTCKIGEILINNAIKLRDSSKEVPLL